MSGFDDSFAIADEAAFVTFGSVPARLFTGDDDEFPADVIEMPLAEGGSYRDGGRQAEIDAEFEIMAAKLRDNGVTQEGWKIEVGGRTFRIHIILWQGGTATLQCQATGDAGAEE